MARVPGPDPMSRTLESGVISVPAIVSSTRWLFSFDIFQNLRALSLFSQIRAQSRVVLLLFI